MRNLDRNKRLAIVCQQYQENKILYWDFVQTVLKIMPLEEVTRPPSQPADLVEGVVAIKHETEEGLFAPDVRSLKKSAQDFIDYYTTSLERCD